MVYNVSPSPTIAIMGSRGSITIPASFREDLELERGSAVILHLEGGRLIVTPAKVTPRLSNEGNKKIHETSMDVDVQPGLSNSGIQLPIGGGI